VVFVDEGNSGFDSHVGTVSRSHTDINGRPMHARPTPDGCSRTPESSGVARAWRSSAEMRAGAGTPPPELAGRDELLESIHVAAERTWRHLAARSELLLGLRGVGKTVLLERVHDRTHADGFATVMIEATERSFIPALLAAELHRALLRLSRQQRLRDRVSRAGRALAGFVSALKRHGLERRSWRHRLYRPLVRPLHAPHYPRPRLAGVAKSGSGRRQAGTKSKSIQRQHRAFHRQTDGPPSRNELKLRGESACRSCGLP